MWSLFDNLGAVLAASALALVLIGLQLTGGDAQQNSVRRSNGQALLTQTADWLERDLLNAGFDVGPGDNALLDYHWSGGAGQFTFVTMSDTSATAVADTVRYTYQRSGGQATLERFRLSGGTSTRTAGTSAALDSLVVELFDESGTAVSGANIARAVEVRVLLRMRSSLGDQDPRAARFVWDRHLFPPNLRRLAP